MNGITTLNISRFQQISSSRPLENAYYEQTQESCEIEIENKLFMREDGVLYTASDALVNWYRKSNYNSLADDITIIIDHDRKHARLDTDPETTDRTPPRLQDFPKAYVPPPAERRQMHIDIRSYTAELTSLLDELDDLQDDQPVSMNRKEMQIVKTVAKIAARTKALFEPEEKD